MKEIQTISYQSEDGQTFNRKEDCELYEDFLNKRIEPFSSNGLTLSFTIFTQEHFREKINSEAVFVKAAGVDTISRFIDLMGEIDDFILIQGTMAESYKDYVVFLWIEDNTWIEIPDIQIKFYKNL